MCKDLWERYSRLTVIINSSDLLRCIQEDAEKVVDLFVMEQFSKVAEENSNKW